MEKTINKVGLGYFINLIRTAIDGKYSVPSTGIPKNILSTQVKNSLDKADTAIAMGEVVMVIDDEENTEA